MMIDDTCTNTQRLERHVTEKEKTPTTPRIGGILVTHVRETNSLSDSRVDEEELDPTLTTHRFSGLSSDVSLGLNATVSAAEKSFKRDDYIYVSFLPCFLLPDLRNHGFLCY